MTRLSGTVKKGWGSEEIFESNDLYCGKILHFKNDAKFSMHFHSEKDETWYILSGEFMVHWIDTSDATQHSQKLKPGMSWRNKPLFPHQLECLEAGNIVEISTPDSVEDNYRVIPGDSQK